MTNNFISQQDCEQKVKELENIKTLCLQLEEYKGFDETKNLILLIEKSKQLREEIEKGCGYISEDEFDWLSLGCGWKIGKYIVDDWKETGEIVYCPNCQNLIQRLNKIIGEEQ